MTQLERFPPTLAAVQSRIGAICLDEYARSRNALDGAVTGLSPYFTHGFLTLPEALAELAGLDVLHVQHKFVYELGWREYFRHVWRHKGDDIFVSLHEGLLPDRCYDRELPADIAMPTRDDLVAARFERAKQEGLESLTQPERTSLLRKLGRVQARNAKP